MRLYWATLGMNQRGSRYLWQTEFELIKDHSNESQWHYINSKQNPADYASRGTDVCNDDKVKRWYLGPQFLWEPEATWDDYQ